MNLKNKLSLLAFSLLTVISAFADEAKVISVIWPFNMGDPPAAYSRIIIDEMNNSQTKYKFVYENKPGAGAAIAAKYVSANPTHTILSGSTSFFVRPNFYPNESHRADQFVELTPQCASPMILVSKKYKNLSTVSSDARLSIGISGLGATSHLLAMQVKARYPNAIIVPYKSTSEAVVDVIGGNLDTAVGFIAEVEGFMDKGDIYGLGITGKKSVKNIPTLDSQGFALVGEMANTLHLVVSKDMPVELQKDLRELISATTKSSKALNDAYKAQYCEAMSLTPAQTESWFKRQIALWAKLSEGIVLDK